MAGGQRHRGLGPRAVPGAGGQSPAWLIACHPAYRADAAGTRAHAVAIGGDFPPGMPQGTAPAILGTTRPAVAGVLGRGPEEEFRYGRYEWRAASGTAGWARAPSPAPA